MHRWLAVCLALGGCGPGVASLGDTDTGGTTSGTSSETTTTSGTTTSGTTTDPTTGPSSTTSVESTTTGPDDANLCLQWCLNASARECGPPFDGEACYTFCRNRIDYAAMDGCAGELRDALACEAQAAPPAEVFCESLECVDTYKRHDLCHGWCTHLGGYPGSGASQTTCDWRSSCYGQEFEVECPVKDAAGLCTCIVDDTVIAQCEVGVSLVAFECGGVDFHLFNTCCAAAFEGVLFP